jgi:hypothetical protein|tara:strand:- start:562 stop:846 length:285 start_codon:yes stop_codon:yes gene_type:complete
MAKNKKKVVDLKPQSITEEELTGVQNIVNGLNRIQMEIGSLESRKHGLAHQVIGLQQQLNTMQTSFKETYGEVDININDGTITYSEDVEADKKD